MNKNKKNCVVLFLVKKIILFSFFSFLKKTLRLARIFQRIFVLNTETAKCNYGILRKEKIHLRHKWLRGQYVQLIKVEKPYYLTSWGMFILRPVDPQNSSDMINSSCLFEF